MGREINRTSDILVLLGAAHADYDRRGHVDRLLGPISSSPGGKDCPSVRWNSESQNDREISMVRAQFLRDSSMLAPVNGR